MKKISKLHKNAKINEEMIPKKFEIIVEKLKEKTKKKELTWTKTCRDDEFKLSIGNVYITTDKWTSSSNENRIDIRIIDKYNDEIDGIEFTSVDKKEYDYLLELYNIIKSDYFKIDETFEIIIKELTSEKTTQNGNEESNQNKKIEDNEYDLDF